jgi:hypothetical protein
MKELNKIKIILTVKKDNFSKKKIIHIYISINI